MEDLLKKELDYVGERKKVKWFSRDLLKNIKFVKLVNRIQQKRNVTFRTTLYSLFPFSEYVAYCKGVEIDFIKGPDSWMNLVLENSVLIESLAVKYGNQGNIPQRAGIILDYLERSRLLTSASATIIELGCSSGLVGVALCMTDELFVKHDGLLAKEYFWLKRFPVITTPYDITYIGYDQVIPPTELVPFFVWDKDKRKKVSAFIKNAKTKGVLFEKKFDSLVDVKRVVSDKPVIFLTAFVMYQLIHPEELMRKILGLVHMHENVHWLDLSRNNNLSNLFRDKTKNALIENHVYLSHNGEQVAHIVNGSDDCPDWEYL